MASANVLVAAGFIIFRRIENQIQYLLLKASYGTKHWTPPKGHVDPGEEEFETALRETTEEAGLTKNQLNILENYQKTICYDVRGKPKRVVYWVAEMKNYDDPVKLSEEHTDFKWLPLDAACEIAKFKEMQKVLCDVDQYLNTAK